MFSNFLRFILFLFIGLGSVSMVRAGEFSLEDLSVPEESNEMFTPFFGDTLITQDSFFVTITDCEAGADICIDIPLVEAPDFTITVNGQAYSGGFSGCDFDTVSAYTYTTLFGSGDLGPYYLTSWDVSGNTFSGQFNNIPDLVDSMNTWDPMGSWLLDASAKLIVGGDPSNTYSDMDVMVLLINSPSFIGYNFGVEANGMQVNLDVGFNEVIFSHNSKNCIDTFYATVACTTPETVNRSLEVNESGTYCIDFSQLIGPPTQIRNLCEDSIASSVDFLFINANTCVDYRGLQAGVDSACLVACDDFGVCDTTYLLVQVGAPVGGSSTFINEIIVGQSEEYCLRRDLFAGSVDTIYNLCPGSSGSNTSFSVDMSTFCVTYSGDVVGGLDSACYVMCDNFGICDTTYMIINVLELPGGSRNITTEVLVNQTKQYCIDTSILAGNLIQFYNACPDSGGTFVGFSLDSTGYCVNYQGIAEGGPRQACVVICDDLGGCDTTNLIVTAIAPAGNVRQIFDTVFVNTVTSYCIDTTIFAGSVDTLYNACVDTSGGFGQLSVDLNSYCVVYTANQLGGLDTACIYLQNDQGAVDTTYLYLTVRSPSRDIVVETVLIGDTETICLDTSELGGNILTVENGCQGSSGTLVDFSIDTTTYCVSYTGSTVGKQDTACFILTDDKGVKDTTLFIIEVTTPTPQMIFDTIVALQTQSFCLDTTELVLAVDTIYSICPVDADTNVTVSLNTSTYCVSYTGLKAGGTDTLCYVLCDNRGVCDTSYLYIFVQEVVLTPEIVYDTITINNSSTICLESEELPGTLISISNDCPAFSGEYVLFNPNNILLCLNYTGVDLGQDTACMVLTDDLGYKDTVTVIVTVTNPQPQTISDSLMVGTTQTFCIDTTELSGIIDTIFNLCEDSADSTVNFVLNPVSLCVDVTGLTPGIDSSCIVICDDKGICDTSYLVITFVPNDTVSTPITVDDIDTTTQNTAVVINVLGNDMVPPNYDLFEIISQPSRGTAVAEPLGTIKYTPNLDFCGATDSLKYRVCNAMSCDTATVVIFVSCEDATKKLTVYDGFSPNGDGKLDVFTIKNIEKYPNHKLYIYNRWGNLVFKNENLRDKWDGKWDGNDVPDGVYFYLLDDGEGSKLSGYVVLRR